MFWILSLIWIGYWININNKWQIITNSRNNSIYLLNFINKEINISEYKTFFWFIKNKVELIFFSNDNIKKGLVRQKKYNHPYYLNSTLPVKKYSISSAFGPRLRASKNYIYNFHRGIDFHWKFWSNVYSITNGIVYRAYVENKSLKNPFKLGGTTVVIKYKLNKPYIFHNKKFYKIYAIYSHLSSINKNILAKVNNKHSYYKVKKGEIIWKLGHSWNTKFNHVHFEIRVWTVCTRKFQLAHPNYKCSKEMPWYAEPSINPYVFLNYKWKLQQKIKVISLNPLTVELISNRSPLIFNSIKIIDWNKIKEVNFDTREWINVNYFNNNDYNNIKILPSKFNEYSKQYKITFIFKWLNNYNKIIAKDIFWNITWEIKK